MNKIGEINLENNIKIMDAFDFVEQFSALTVSNTKEGLWLAFNEMPIEYEEIENDNDKIPNFYLVESKYFEKSNHVEAYNWERNENFISIEKGAIGIYNNSLCLKMSDVEQYYKNMDEAISQPYQDGLKNQYIAFLTPYGNDGYFAFDTVQENGKIVAIRIVLEELDYI